MFYAKLFFTCFLVYFAVASASEYTEESSFELPADWANIRSNIDTSFSCVGRAFGYYSDIHNDCQLYHVCNPREENGVTVYSHSPFICPLGTVFDQRSTACIHSTPDFSCAESVQHYAETENRYANENEASASPFVDTPVASEQTPPVNENVVLNNPVNVEIVPNNPIYSPVEKPVLNESPVAQPVVENVASTPVSTPVESVPNVPSNSESVNAPVSSDVHSNEHSEVPHVQPVAEIVHQNRLSSQNHIVLKPINVSKGPSKSTQQQEIQKISVPVAKVPQVSVKAPVPVAKLPQQQVVQKVQAPIPVAKLPQQQVAQQVQAPIPVAKLPQQQVVQQVQAPIPVAKLPQQQVVQKVQAPIPVAKLPQQQVVQQVQAPTKAPVAPVVAKISQKVQAPIPVAKVPQQQVVQQVEQPSKSIRAVPRPIFRQQPRKSTGPVKQHLLRHHVPEHVSFNGLPTWRHHYIRLLPHLISNNPYHVSRVNSHK